MFTSLQCLQDSSQGETFTPPADTLSQTAAKLAAPFILATRFPARLWQHYRHPLKLWLLARLMDDVVKDGQSAGSGVATMSIEAAAMILGYSENRIYKLLREAQRKGLIHRYHLRRDGWVRIFYASLERVSKAARLTELGRIAEIEIKDLKYIGIIATELEAEEQQERSFHAAQKASLEQQEEGNLKKFDTSLIHPEKLTNSPCRMGRVLGVGERFLRVSEGFVPFGASQETIAKNRGVSVRTVQRHLSNGYRLELTEVRQRRRIDCAIEKWQLAQRLPRRFSPIDHPKAGIDSGRYQWMDDRWYELKCNVYRLRHWTVPARYLRQELITISDGKKGARRGLDPYKGS